MRELKNVVERLLILSTTDPIGEGEVVELLGASRADAGSNLLDLETLKQFREEAERRFLLQKLDQNDWNVTRTAQAIETPRSNLYKKMDQYGIRRDQAADGA